MPVSRTREAGRLGGPRFAFASQPQSVGLQDIASASANQSLTVFAEPAPHPNPLPAKGGEREQNEVAAPPNQVSSCSSPTASLDPHGEEARQRHLEPLRPPPWPHPSRRLLRKLLRMRR